MRREGSGGVEVKVMLGDADADVLKNSNKTNLTNTKIVVQNAVKVAF